MKLNIRYHLMIAGNLGTTVFVEENSRQPSDAIYQEYQFESFTIHN
jgi:hypothetical protein